MVNSISRVQALKLALDQFRKNKAFNEIKKLIVAEDISDDSEFITGFSKNKTQDHISTSCNGAFSLKRKNQIFISGPSNLIAYSSDENYAYEINTELTKIRLSQFKKKPLIQTRNKVIEISYPLCEEYNEACPWLIRIQTKSISEQLIAELLATNLLCSLSLDEQGDNSLDLKQHYKEQDFQSNIASVYTAHKPMINRLFVTGNENLLLFHSSHKKELFKPFSSLYFRDRGPIEKSELIKTAINHVNIYKIPVCFEGTCLMKINFNLKHLQAIDHKDSIEDF